MRIAVTGGTGFIGHYIVRRQASADTTTRDPRKECKPAPMSVANTDKLLLASRASNVLLLLELESRAGWVSLT
jgi:uncharacterized protein YbjT (DUF2867 family)